VKALQKIAKGHRYRYLPLVAFEIASSEHEKQLRGSLVTLQLTNAAASVIVLLGECIKYKSYQKKLVGRYSFVRYRIWTEKDVDDFNDVVFKPEKKRGPIHAPDHRAKGRLSAE